MMSYSYPLDVNHEVLIVLRRTKLVLERQQVIQQSTQLSLTLHFDEKAGVFSL